MTGTDGRLTVRTTSRPGRSPGRFRALRETPTEELRTVVDILATAFGALAPTLEDLLEQLAANYDGSRWAAEKFDEGDRLVQSFRIGTPHRDVTGRPVRMVTVADEDGLTVLLAARRGVHRPARRRGPRGAGSPARHHSVTAPWTSAAATASGGRARAASAW